MMDAKVLISALRWSAPIRARPNKGRWIVVLFEFDTHLILGGYRFQSKAEAGRFARKRAKDRVRAIVRRFHRRHWKRRVTTTWTSVATETLRWCWMMSSPIAKGTPL